MRWGSIVILLLSAVSALGQAPVITEGTPVVNQGQTLQFHETLGEAGTWAFASTHAGTLTGGGLYTAPATVTPQQTIGGYQLGANNSIWNQRVDGLPLRSDNATLMTGLGVNPLTTKEIYSNPINYCDGATPLVAMNFGNTPGNNGNFQIPTYPGVMIQGGWLNRWRFDIDHHLICVDHTTGVVQEIYQYRPTLVATATDVGITGGPNVATVTFSSDPSVAGAGYVVGQLVALKGYTGADTFFNTGAGAYVTLTSVSSSQVQFALTHAAAAATSNGKMSMLTDCPSAGLDDCNSTSGIRYLNSTYNLPNVVGGSTNAAGTPLMPGTLRVQEYANAVANSSTINHVLLMSTGNNHICQTSNANGCYSGQPNGSRHIWPATNEAFAGSGLIPYGLVFRLKAAYNCAALSSIAQILCTQMKQFGVMMTDGGTDWSIAGETGKWPAAIIAALQEIDNAQIPFASNFEIPDLLTIQATASQTCPTPNNCSLTNVTPERVCFTRTSDSAVACVDVALMGVAVNLPTNSMDVQAGTTAQQLAAFVHGGANNTVTWSVSPAITGGSLSSGGLLTPPATIAAATNYTVTATSTDNAAISASMNLTIYPTGSIYIRPAASSSFTDSHGHVWAVGGGSGDHLGCCGDITDGSSWGSLVDKQIYYFRSLTNEDELFKFTVPNGTYKVTIKLATDQGCCFGTADGLDLQGNLLFPYIDVNTQAGGNFKPADMIMNGTVTNGTLLIGIREPYLHVPGGISIINAIQIDPVSFPPAPIKPGVLFGRTYRRGWNAGSRHGNFEAFRFRE